MDALRSILMLLGVVLHSARRTTRRLAGQGPGPPATLDWLVSGIHLFRMPAFFVVAGYFAMYLLVRWPVREFLRDRMRRVLVPLLATLLTFNLVQVWLVMGSGATPGFLRGALLPAWFAGRWVSHLWFLVSLALYFALAATSGAVSAPPRRPRGCRRLLVAWTLGLALRAAHPCRHAAGGGAAGPSRRSRVG
jgi:glucan biosynthesis protein C